MESNSDGQHDNPTPAQQRDDFMTQQMLKRNRENEERMQRAMTQSRQSAAEKTAAAIASSFPAQLKRILNGAAYQVSPLCSAPLKAEATKNAEAVAAICKQLDAGVEQLRSALTAATENQNYGDIATAVENVRFDRTLLLQQAVAVWKTSGELARKAATELEPIVTKQVAEAEAVLADIKKKLTDMGSGVEAQMAYPKHGNAAARQFDFAARMNVNARKAIATAEDTRLARNSALTFAATAKRRCDDVAELLHETVLKSVRI